jgi:hypothetical protein
VSPKLADFFEWQSDEGFHQEILITNAERKKLNCSNKLFYVGVATVHPTQYTLTATVNDGQTVNIDFNLPIRYLVIATDIAVKYLRKKSSTIV